MKIYKIMLRSFIVDNERNLVESNDLLGTMCYANQLADAIKNVPDELAYTIGLYGKWGSGKSTIIRTAKDILEKETNKNIKVVVYDAWKYSGDSFRRMFLLHLQEELKINPSTDMKCFYTATTEEIEPKVELKTRGIIVAVLILIIGIVITYWLASSGKLEATIPAMAVVTLCTLFFNMFGGFFYELKVTETKNKLFAPEQFEACFMQMMEIVLKKKGWFRQMAHVTEKFFDGNWKSPNLDKLVIVIDNLDRCDTDVVYSMLTDIKTFLGTEKYDVAFVVPVDHDALKKHLFAKREYNPIDAEEFLRKFFNVVIRMKEHRHDDLLHYIHELNRDQELGFNPDTLSMVAKEYAENPRRIVQMLNNLTVEQSQYDEEFARKHETLIAICMILKEHYPYAVTKIIANPKILKSEDIYKDSAALFQNEKDAPAKNDDNLRTTLCIAKNILKNAEEADVRKILINTDNALSNLSGDVLQAMNSFNAQAIVSYIQENMARKEDVCIELLRRIHDEKEYGAKNQIVQWVECVAKINEKCPFEASVLQKIHEETKEVYEEILTSSVEATNAVCLLANDLNKIGFSEMKDGIMGFIKNPQNEKAGMYHKYVSSSFIIFDSKEDCERLSEFGRKYLFNIDDLDQYAFTENHKLYMLGSPFAMSVVSSITSTDQDKAQHQAEWCFRNLSDIKDDVYEKLFTQYVSLIGQRDRKPVTVFVNVVSYAMPILRSITSTTNTEKLSAFYNTVVNKRITPSNQNVSIVNEVENESAKLIADFCLEMYRISGEKITVNPTLENVQKKCEDYVKARIIVRMREGNTMLPFRRNILALDTIDEGWYELIPYAFEKDASGNLIDKTLLTGKLQWMYDNMEDAKALAMLVKLTEDNDVCDLFLTIPDLSNYDTLNNMPASLLPRIINRYTSDNAEHFKGNNAMLKVVLKNGKSTQKNLVVNSLIDRINHNQDMDGVLDVVNSYEKWRKTDKNVLRDMLQRNMPEETGAELTEMQAKIKNVIDGLK